MKDNVDYDKRGFLQRYGFALGVSSVAALVVVIFVGQAFSGHKAPPRRVQEITMVKLLPTPPPPPPPPPKLQEPKPEDDKMIEQPPVDDQEPKPDDKPKDQPAAGPVGTGIKGDGAGDAFGLGGGGSFLGGSGGSGYHGGRWGWYAGRVQSAVSEALRRNERTREATFHVEARIWPDATGRIMRTQLVGSTGDRALDNAITNEILTGLQLQEAPPAGMPTPIVLRLAARRPN